MGRAAGDAAEGPWRALYRAGGWAAIGVLVLVPLQIAVYVLAPPPETAAAWFELFERSTFLGLADLDLFLMVDQVLIAVLFLAVCVALRRTSPSWVALALLFEVVAIATYLSSNTAFEMLALSRQHAAATNDAQRLAATAAADAMLATTFKGSAFTVSYVLGALATLTVSGVMLRGAVFSRATAWVGIVFGALSLVPASAGALGVVMSLASLVPMWAWFVLLASRLLRLARTSDG